VSIGTNKTESSFAQAILDAGEKPLIGSKPIDEDDRLGIC
jgi:hypothetical protein